MDMAAEDDVGLVASNPIGQLDIAIMFSAIPTGGRAMGRGMIDPDPGRLLLGAIACQLLFNTLFDPGAIPPGAHRDEDVANRHAVAVGLYAHLAHPAHPLGGPFAA